uniref:PH domain-containing protein n=1 Tax=Anopheles atroparvus TaxID=41427 RepID=A0A182IL70_ANOAO
MKKFMSTKAAAPSSPPPPTSPLPAPAAPPASPSSPADPTSTFATFEALLRAANPAEHPSLARKRTVGASNRKASRAPRPPATPHAVLTFDFPPRDGDSGDAPATSKSTPSLASPSSSSIATTTTTTTTTTTGVIKMCGYLKKKRNKMGGWRKLFFILQNQLLLSYSSRDDYEKKLAPFKDIINLVPGTVIIPTTGPRFTIETNSKVMYTFRCDDQGSCSEWITALLDSLKAVNGGLNNDRTFSPQNIFQRSTLPLTSFVLPPPGKRFDRAVQRSDSGSRAAVLAALDAPPKPPRSFNTQVHQQQRRSTSQQQEISDDALNNNVSLLKPLVADAGNSVSSSSINSNNSRESSSIRSKILAFESHANLHKAQESVPTTKDTKDDVEGSVQQQHDEEGQASEGERHDSDGCREGQNGVAEETEPEPDRWKWWLRGREAAGERQQQQRGETEACAVLASEKVDADGKVEQHAAREEEEASVQEARDEERLEQQDGGERTMHSARQQQQQQQQIFRLHPNAWRKTHQSMDVCRINSMFGERTPESAGGLLRSGNQQPQQAVKREQRGQQEQAKDPGDRKPIASSCSAQPSVTPNQHMLREAPENTDGAPAASSVVYADVCDYRKSPSEQREATNEPIYAVVDMRAKRTRRAARQHQPEGERPDRAEQPFVSVSLPQIPSATQSDSQRERTVAKRCYSSSNNNNDYEDVNDFLDRLEEGEGGQRALAYDRAIPACGDDHIYEPILVPEQMNASDTSGSSTSLPASSSSGQLSSTASPSGAGGSGSLWKQLKRMHLQGSRQRLALRRVFSSIRAADGAVAVQRQSTSEGEAEPGRTPSALEGLGRRFDSQRRSIKKRIKSLYDRGGLAGGAPPTTASSTASSSTSDEPRSQPPVQPFSRAEASRQSRKSLSLDSFLAARGRATTGQPTPLLLLETTKTK